MFKQFIRRVLPAAMVSQQEREIRQGIRELRQYSDYELADLGIPRSQIEHCVRHGRPGGEPRVAPTGSGQRATSARQRPAPTRDDAAAQDDLAA